MLGTRLSTSTGQPNPPGLPENINIKHQGQRHHDLIQGHHLSEVPSETNKGGPASSLSSVAMLHGVNGEISGDLSCCSTLGRWKALLAHLDDARLVLGNVVPEESEWVGRNRNAVHLISVA